jgi:dihydrofolate reductase
MGTLTVVEDLSLDGVAQAPGRPDEDERGGFAHGGWAVPYFDEVKLGVMAEGMELGMARGALLLGRRTYQDFAAFWPHQVDNPFTPVLDAMTKHVVSRRQQELGWRHSVLHVGEAADSVRRLKQQPEDLTVLGSTDLVRTLVRHGLVDEYLLCIHPLLLGGGMRLFAEETAPSTPVRRLELVEATSTTTGVVICRYRPAV